jgi:hypothetical protein
MIFFAATYGHDMFGHGVEVLLSSLGSILVVFGHLRNLKLRNISTSVMAK